MKMKFDLLQTDANSQARAGVVHTDHGAIETLYLCQSVPSVP
jgi:queuine tRNA-ribosyltransferase